MEHIAQQIRLPHEIRNWTLLTDEEKCANVLTSVVIEGRLQELVCAHHHDNDDHNGNGHFDSGHHDNSDEEGSKWMSSIVKDISTLDDIETKETEI